ncbi:hypothetical protein HA466_0029510 [Hirschfeldia incana]|nr:hypothetical protein HA466_0029510 [Hirschfeldia incana]
MYLSMAPFIIHSISSQIFIPMVYNGGDKKEFHIGGRQKKVIDQYINTKIYTKIKLPWDNQPRRYRLKDSQSNVIYVNSTLGESYNVEDYQLYTHWYTSPPNRAINIGIYANRIELSSSGGLGIKQSDGSKKYYFSVTGYPIRDGADGLIFEGFEPLGDEVEEENGKPLEKASAKMKGPEGDDHDDDDGTTAESTSKTD